jgi:hypothetical protein
LLGLLSCRRTNCEQLLKQGKSMGDLSVLHLPSGPTALVAKVHPVVLFNISDAYIRRNEGQERVIGTLLGTVSSDGTVEIKNSYAVPHKETSDEVSMSQLLPLLFSGLSVALW